MHVTTNYTFTLGKLFRLLPSSVILLFCYYSCYISYTRIYLLYVLYILYICIYSSVIYVIILSYLVKLINLQSILRRKVLYMHLITFFLSKQYSMACEHLIKTKFESLLYF